MPDPHEPDVEGLIRDGAKAGAKEIKIRYWDRRLILIYLFMVLIATEQVWFEKASHSNCESQRAIVQKFDGYLDRQIAIIQNRTTLAPSVKQATIANYKSARLHVPTCTVLVVP